VIVTGTAQREAWLARALPAVEQVGGGVWSVPVTMPDSPLRYTLCYLLAGDAGVVVVDPGQESDTGWADLLRGLQSAGIPAHRVTGIVVTHTHPDHHGLSGRLREASGGWIAMHAAEADSLPARMLRRIGGRGGDRAWLARCGVPADVIAELAVGGPDSPLYRMAEPDVLVADGDELDLAGRRVRVVWTPGHTPGHICLHDVDQDLLLTGDHLLPRISPNIGLSPAGMTSALASYLESLGGMRAYDSAEALPAHEYRFRGVGDRADALIGHHRARAREVLEVIGAAGRPTVWEVTQQLTWSRSWPEVTGFMRRAALAETAAHICYLEEPAGLVSRSSQPRGPDRLSVARPDGAAPATAPRR
jgi:glyoxylase-like metal-dependent hydrolase (beta-lactamase superfamily II)